MSRYTYSDAERDIKRGRNGRKKLDNQTYLYSRNGCFVVELYCSRVVTLYPDHQVLDMHGWRTQTTLKIINNFSATCTVFFHSHAGVEDTIRIGRFPFFDGIRIHNNGDVFQEDIRSDWKKIVRPEITRQWKAIHMPITKVLRSRFELGEFDEVDQVCFRNGEALDTLLALDPVFPDHDSVLQIMSIASDAVRSKAYWQPASRRAPEERWKAALTELRALYYTRNNGHMTVEIPHV